MANDSNVDRKSIAANDPSTLKKGEEFVNSDSKTKTIPKALDFGEKNILHNYRTFNYLFTLAAVGDDALRNPDKLRTSENYLPVAKSSGKSSKVFEGVGVTRRKVALGRAAPNADGSPQTIEVRDGPASPLIDGFNNLSSGRFDLFLNNVEITTLMAFSKNTNLTMATNISFEVFEPHSISGFIEALQVSAVAAGNKSYMSAPFLLKMEFMGYPDTDTSPSDNYQSVGDQATRYFIITITKVEVDMSETGTRYRCQAVAHNEMAYGTMNQIKHAIKMEGSTVKKVLASLMKSLDDSSQQAAVAAAGKNNKSPIVWDTYGIIYPSRMPGGKFDYNKVNTDIADATIVQGISSPNNFAMPETGDVAAANDKNAQRGQPPVEQDCFKGNTATDTAKAKAGPDTPSNLQFSSGSNIHDIIASVIRDSSYGKKILEKGPDKDGMVDYVHIAVESQPTGEWNAVTLRPTYKYVYVVLPYRMHASRVPMFQKQLSKDDVNKLKTLYVKRKYSYLYTGKNVDVRKFNLRFNTLFYQAFPQGMGTNIFADPQANYEKSTVKKRIDPTDTARSEQNIIPASPMGEDPAAAQVQKIGGTGGRRDYKEYDVLVENMHRAVINNIDMVSCELEILGDPYFLCTGGNGNYRPELVDAGITKNGEAPYQTGDVIVIVEFQTPQDAGVTDQAIKFYNTPFSGCFRVTKVRSKFNDGLFTQVLSMIRIPGQPEDASPAKQVAVASAPDTYLSDDVA
jgi:hypothetical protein